MSTVSCFHSFQSLRKTARFERSECVNQGGRDESRRQEQEQTLGSVGYNSTLKCQGAVYLNQLMSFSAVAAPSLMALKQTSTFRDKMQEQLWALVTTFSIPIQVLGVRGAAG